LPPVIPTTPKKGIGENSPIVRALVCEGLEGAGIALDARANEAAVGEPAIISAPGSRVKVLVIPTDEELSIARQTLEVVQAGGGVLAGGAAAA
jgi:acetate kinase